MCITATVNSQRTVTDVKDVDNVDWRLLRRQLREGDIESYSTLFRDAVDRVHRVAASLCGDASLAEDITAETFLIAWRRRSSITDQDAPVVPWLMAIAARQAQNASRGRRRQQAFVARNAHRFETVSPDIADEITTRIDAAAHVRRTQEALAALAADEREVLALCVWSGLSIREVALALGVPPGTVRSRLSRTRNRLRAALDDVTSSEPPDLEHPSAPTPEVFNECQS